MTFIKFTEQTLTNFLDQMESDDIEAVLREAEHDEYSEINNALDVLQWYNIIDLNLIDKHEIAADYWDKCKTDYWETAIKHCLGRKNVFWTYRNGTTYMGIPDLGSSEVLEWNDNRFSDLVAEHAKHFTEITDLTDWIAEMND